MSDNGILEEVVLENGEIAYKLSEQQAKALGKIIEDRLWWDEALRRGKRIGVIVGIILASLALLSTWWPWITRMVQFLIQDVPTK